MHLPVTVNRQQTNRVLPNKTKLTGNLHVAEIVSLENKLFDRTEPNQGILTFMLIVLFRIIAIIELQIVSTHQFMRRQFIVYETTI